MARLVSVAGSFQKVGHPESYLAVDKHDSSELRAMVKRKERSSVILANLLIIVMVLVADRFIGWRTCLLIQLPAEEVFRCRSGAARKSAAHNH